MWNGMWCYCEYTKLLRLLGLIVVKNGIGVITVNIQFVMVTNTDCCVNCKH